MYFAFFISYILEAYNLRFIRRNRLPSFIYQYSTCTVYELFLI